MQKFIAVFALFFAALVVAAPIVEDKRQITPSGNNNYGDDGLPSQTDGSGNIVPYSNPAAASASPTA
ncbi:hypothetical protein RUND412_003638 [Rhizina undulata]